jgi:hypothetical protein
VWFNPGEVAGDGIDNDGNGLVDDVNGYDFVNKDSSVYDGEPASWSASSRGAPALLRAWWLRAVARGTERQARPSGVHTRRRAGAGGDNHGTHVAGTMGAAADGAGVVGVNWNVKLISAKFLGPNGGSIFDAVRALDYLTSLRTQRGLNIVATSNSWGGGGYSQALFDAIARSNTAGMLFVAAAGNSRRPSGLLLWHMLWRLLFARPCACVHTCGLLLPPPGAPTACCWLTFGWQLISNSGPCTPPPVPPPSTPLTCRRPEHRQEGHLPSLLQPAERHLRGSYRQAGRSGKLQQLRQPHLQPGRAWGECAPCSLHTCMARAQYISPPVRCIQAQ